MAKKQNAVPNGLMSRSKELLTLAASVGAKELGGRVSRALSSTENPLQKLNTQLEQAKLVMECLGRLKGAAMKVGQLLSIEARDLFPPEVIDILSQLQSQAEPECFLKIQEVLKQELGEERFSQITDLDPSPLASASIGQVHRARYQGRDIVLKVQYPGVAESIPTDLKILAKVSSAFMGLGGKSIHLDALFEEMEKVLMQEADYLAEGRLMQEYAAFLMARGAEFCVPQWFAELSTARVLAMTYEEGLHVDSYMATCPPLEERNLFAKRILDLYMEEFFRNGLVQTDPNFSNFLFRPLIGQVVVLDFGASRRYDEGFRKCYRELLMVIRSGERRETLAKCVAMGLIDERESEECLEYFLQMLTKSGEPFHDARQPFEFGDLDYVKEARQSVLDFTRRIQYSAPPHQLIFLHRKLGGVFHLLKTLQARVDLSPYWDEIALS